MKPLGYEEQYVVKRHTSYQLRGESQRGIFSEGGVLREGAVVWLDQIPDKSATDTLVSAYAEDVGLIVLDSRLLARAS